MTRQKFNVFICLIVSGCAQATPHLNVDVDNQLSNCIKIEEMEIVTDNELPMLKVHYQKKSAISACGCKSAISTYSSTLQMDGYDSFLMSGQFIFDSENKFKLPIATSQKIIGDYRVAVSFSCAKPD